MPRGRTPIRFRGTPLPRPVAPRSNATQNPFDVLSMMEELRKMHTDLTVKADMVQKALQAFEAVKKGPAGLPGVSGRPGMDGQSVTPEMVAAEVKRLYQQPKDGVSPTAEEIATAMLNSPKIYKFIQKRLPSAPKDGVSPEVDSLVQEALKRMQAGALKIEHVAGLDGKFREIYNQLSGKIYGRDTMVRGGGDTVVAGTGVTIVDTRNGNKQINAVAVPATWKTPTGTVDGSNTVFGVTSQPSIVIADGTTLFENVGYTYSGGNITFTNAPTVYVRYQ